MVDNHGQGTVVPRVLLSVVLALCAVGFAEEETLVPPCVEVDADHPLFVFSISTRDGTLIDSGTVIKAWDTCPAQIKPFAVLRIALPALGTADDFLERAKALLSDVQPLNIPIALVIADREPTWAVSSEALATLLDSFSCIRAVIIRGITFNDYYNFGTIYPMPELPQIRYLRDTIRTTAQYGRLLLLLLEDLEGPRMMSNPLATSWYGDLKKYSTYCIPVVSYRGNHILPQLSAIFGLWIEGSCMNWGVAPDSRWYSDAHCIAPGKYGVPQATDLMPPALYRAMILNGVMTGAAVFFFEQGSDLWFSENMTSWEKAILPTLLDALYMRLIPTRETVLTKVRAAYQLAPSRTPEDFHLNLRDIDGEFDQGMLLQGAYGLESPGLVSELVPNSGRHYWVPFVSSFASPEALKNIPRIIQPGIHNSPQAWTETLDRLYEPDGEGSAFICRVGRGIFVMNTRENSFERQRFRLTAVPAALRNFEARRTSNGITLSWPFREGDVGYRIYRRIPPQRVFVRVVDDLSERTWTDVTVGEVEQVAYAVTALTNEEEPLEGEVGYGEYLALSTVESRIAEEVVLGPLLESAFSRPIERSVSQEEEPLETWWLTKQTLSDAQLTVAENIASQITQWENAFTNKDLDEIMALYHPEYTDSEGWGTQYVRRAYQWFFERYGSCKMGKQIRQWIFPDQTQELEQADIVIYCRFSGVAVSDPTGRFGDIQAFFPRTENGEVRLRFAQSEDGKWKIIASEPALPNFKDILSFSVGPFDRFQLGRDTYAP